MQQKLLFGHLLKRYPPKIAKVIIMVTKFTQFSLTMLHRRNYDTCFFLTMGDNIYVLYRASNIILQVERHMIIDEINSILFLCALSNIFLQISFFLYIIL